MSAKTTVITADKQYCVFRLSGMGFAIEAGKVQEVLKAHEWTPVPLAHGGVRGVMNLRGQIVTVLDLRSRLALELVKEEKTLTHMILRFKNEIVSLLVDEIGDVVEIAADSFEEPPATLAPEIRPYILGAFKLKDQLLLDLNIEEALQAKN